LFGASSTKRETISSFLLTDKNFPLDEVRSVRKGRSVGEATAIALFKNHI
jgi:hypothetical protein